MLLEPLEPQLRERILAKLSYTRKLFISAASEFECNLWPFLLTAIAVPYLLPNLKLLVISWDKVSVAHSSWISLLVSPSIERVAHVNLAPPYHSSFVLVQGALLRHRAPVSRVDFHNSMNATTGVVGQLVHSTAATLSLNITAPTFPEGGCYPMWFLAFGGSPNLTHLQIREGNQTDVSTQWSFHRRRPVVEFKTLQTLELHGTFARYDEVFVRLACPSLVSLSLYLQVLPSWQNLLDSLAHFPKLGSLSVTISSSAFPQLHLEQLRVILKTPLTSLQLLGAESHLTEDDFVQVLTLCPSLRCLVVAGVGSVPIDSSTLCRPQLASLEELCFPMDFTSGMLSPPGELVGHHSCKRLLIHNDSKLPDSMAPKLKMAEFLCRVIPFGEISPLFPHATGSSTVRDIEALRRYISKNISTR